MRVAVKHQVPVWVEVDLKTKEVDRVVVDDESMSKPIEYRVILDSGIYDTTRYPGKKMAKTARKIEDNPKNEAGWPPWQFGW